MISEERASAVASDRSMSSRSIALQANGHRPDGSLECELSERQESAVKNALGAACAVSGQRQLSLVDQLALMEQERQRIAAELHDGLGQSLCLLSRLIRKTVGLVDEGARNQIEQHLDQVVRTVDGILAELRRTSMNLRPSMLDDLGLLATLSWFLREVELSCPAIEIERRIRVVESDVPENLKTAVFRIVQEAFTNALKHAQPGRLRVMLAKRRDRLQLSVQDDGRGFELSEVLGKPAACGYGLHSMQVRASGSGGRLVIQSAPGQGTHIQVDWPTFCGAAAA